MRLASHSLHYISTWRCVVMLLSCSTNQIPNIISIGIACIFFVAVLLYIQLTTPNVKFKIILSPFLLEVITPKQQSNNKCQVEKRHIILFASVCHIKNKDTCQTYKRSGLGGLTRRLSTTTRAMISYKSESISSAVQNIRNELRTLQAKKTASLFTNKS